VSGLGLREYARSRRARGLAGGSLRAVQEAIESGRLAGAITPDGRIVSIELADAAWTAATYEDRIPITGPAAAVSTAVSPPTPTTPDGPPALALSRARREAALAERAELELAERRGKVIDVDQARADVIAAFSLVKTRLLAVPSRARQRDHSLTAPQLELIDELIREALEELADRGARLTGEEEPC